MPYALFKDGENLGLTCDTISGILITADMNNALEDGRLKKGYEIKEVKE